VNRLVLISGCSGGGKSTLLTALAARGHDVVEEPGRRVVQRETASGGKALPWVDMAAFLRRTLDLALADLATQGSSNRWTFFDRGLIDAAAPLEKLTGEALLTPLRAAERYYPAVFLAPPWPEIFRFDAERRHALDAAEAEYRQLATLYPRLGYRIILLPKTDVESRADFVLDRLADA
jgi:predicted ATPase